MSGHADHKMQEEHRALLKKVDELSEKLYRVNQRLKDSETLKGHFISNITNEIINPFSSILVLSENMQKLRDGQMDEAKRMANSIFNEAFHLDFQLKNIFAAAAIEAGVDDLKPVSVNVKRLFKKSIQFFQKQMEQKKINLDLIIEKSDELEKLNEFVTDEEKLELVLKNILDNAIKFSFEGGQINVSLSFKNGHLCFSVRDFGKGIPAEKKQEIFDRFHQLDERINSINTGHGLGLSIVNSYLFLLNGEAKLDTELQQGTSMLISLNELEKDDEWDDLDEFLIDPDENF